MATAANCRLLAIVLLFNDKPLLTKHDEWVLPVSTKTIQNRTSIMCSSGRDMRTGPKMAAPFVQKANADVAAILERSQMEILLY